MSVSLAIKSFSGHLQDIELADSSVRTRRITYDNTHIIVVHPRFHFQDSVSISFRRERSCKHATVVPNL